MDIIPKINMSKIYKGIITKVVPYKESDAIITLLTKDEGVISFKARGVFKINSKNASSLQLYSIGEYKIESKSDYSNKTLSSSMTEYFPICIYEDLKYSIFLSFINELINYLKDDYIESYNLLELAIKNLKNIDLLTYTLIALKYFLKNNGVLFEVDECVNCHRKTIEVFSYSSGGFLCKKCMIDSNYNINNLTYLKQIRTIMKAKIENVFLFSVDNTMGYKILLDLIKYIENNIGIYFKTKEMVFMLFNNTDSRLTR